MSTFENFVKITSHSHRTTKVQSRISKKNNRLKETKLIIFYNLFHNIIISNDCSVAVNSKRNIES